MSALARYLPDQSATIGHRIRSCLWGEQRLNKDRLIDRSYCRSGRVFGDQLGIMCSWKKLPTSDFYKHRMLSYRNTDLLHPEDMSIDTQSALMRRGRLVNNQRHATRLRPRDFGVGLIVAVLFSLATAGCSPSLAPLYTDFEAVANVVPNDTLLVRIERAIESAGWTQVDSPADNVVATEERTISKWGLYDVRVSIELAPVTDQYVRVFINPYRVFVTGSRSKMPYLKRGIRRSVVPELERALAQEGIEPIGSAVERARLAERERGSN